MWSQNTQESDLIAQPGRGSRFVHQNQTSNPFEPLQKSWTLNRLSQKQAISRPKSGKIELWTQFQTQIHLPKSNKMNPLEISKNTVLRTHELGLLKGLIICKIDKSYIVLLLGSLSLRWAIFSLGTQGAFSHFRDVSSGWAWFALLGSAYDTYY